MYNAVKNYFKNIKIKIDKYIKFANNFKETTLDE